MNDTQLELFLAITDAGSFTKAEQTQFISKQAMIKQITNLEREVGVTLFERTRSGIVLTEEGKIFYTGAKELLLQKKELCLKLLTHAGKNQLRIGNVQHQVILNRVIDAFSKQYPEIEIERVVHPNHSGEYRVEHDIQDIAESFESDQSTSTLPYAFFPLLKVSYFIMVDANHPLSKHETVTLDDLQSYPVTYFPLMMKQAYIEQLQKAFASTNQLRASYDVDHQIEEVFSIQSTNRIVIGANPVMKTLKGIVTIPLAENWSRTYGVISSNQPSATTRIFLEFAKQYYTK